jgi:hypothetical protein
MKFFHAWELVSRAEYDVAGEGSLSLFDAEAIIALDDLREFFGVGIMINNWYTGGLFQHRGYRTLADELAANPHSSGHSAHQVGKAFDCDIQGFTAEEARKCILENQDNPLLRRIMRMEADKNWVHFDVLTLPPGMRRIHLFKA